jgi:intracellular septation protein A
MKILFDLFPVILFFVAFKYSEKNPELAASWVGSLLGSATVDLKMAPILLATVVVIAATVAQIIWVWFRHGKVDKMLWVSLVLVVVFGGMTLVFQDESFIKWKPTILYWVFAGSMAFGAIVLKKNAIKAMLRRANDATGKSLDQGQLLLGRLLYIHGHPESGHRLQFFDRCLGKFQTFRRHGPLTSLRPDSGHVAIQIR